MSTGRRAYDLLRGYVNRELDRVRGLDRLDAEKELAASLNPGSSVTQQTSKNGLEIDEPALARKILGVSADADFVTIRKTFERLDRRSDPVNFPEKSLERQQAAELRQRVHWAYSVLTQNVPDLNKRFGSLEIEPPQS